MIEIQCTSCHTRYRVDERVLPEDTPTFKCSRCGHVFTADPVRLKGSKPLDQSNPPKPDPARAARTPGAQARPIFGRREEAPAADEPREAPSSPAGQEPAPAPRPGPFARPRANPPEAAAQPPQESAFATKPERPFPEQQRPEGPQAKPSNAEDFSEPRRAFVDAIRPTPSVAPASATPPPATPEPPHPGPEPIRSGAAVPPGIQTPRPQQPRSSEPPRDAAPRQDLFRRSVEEPDESASGENLSFDFHEDRGPEADSPDEPVAPEQWSVGDEFVDQPERGAEPQPGGRPRLEPFGPAPGPGKSPFADDIAFVERSGLHSAGYFIGLFFVVAVIFAAMALSIGAAPAASAALLRSIPILGPNFETPVSLESLVGLGDIQSRYQTLKDGHCALVITGTVKNGASVALHAVQVGAQLLDSSKHPVASGATFCGTAISAKMLTEMTPHELEFLQRVDPPRSFLLAPEGTAPFMMVFTDPPKNVNQLALMVAKAQPAAVAQESPAPQK